MKNNPLNLYRLHARSCAAGHKLKAMSGESEERKRSAKKCSCPIYASGTLQGKFGRRTTRETDWEAARTVAASWTEWDPKPTPPPSPSPSPSSRRKALSEIERAIRAYLEEHESEGSALHTKEGHRTLQRKLESFCEERGYVLLAQLTDVAIMDFRGTMKVKEGTRRTYMKRLHAFLAFCVARKWLSANPASELYAIVNRKNRNGEEAERLPFTDAELERMFAVLRDRYDDFYHPRKWTSTDMMVFINLLLHTGFRIGDGCAFDARHLKADRRLTVRTTKTGKAVDVRLPLWLEDQIRERARIHGPRIFGVSSGRRPDALANLWRERCVNLFKLCGPWSTAPVPHRFRDTTARIFLQEGLTCADVADILGNTEQVVRKHYAPWVPERQARIDAIFEKAFGNRPIPVFPKVVEIKEWKTEKAI